MQKTYVLDANVLLQAPYALESFEDNHIVLPLAVLEELDDRKGADGEAGNNARHVLRFLERLRLQGDLVKGVTLPSGGTVRLEVNHVDAALPQGIEPDSRAGRVLKVCRGLMDEGAPVTLVSRDMVARIRAQMMEVPAEDFTTDRLPDGAQPYTGRAEVYIPDDLLPAFKKKGAPAEELYTVDGAGERKPVSLTENQFVLLHSDTEPKKTMLGRFREGKVAALRFGGVRPFGVKPRSVGQQFLQEALLLPVAEAIGVDPIHFGIIMCVNLAIGFVTPPMGANLFVASNLSKVSVFDIARKAVPFILAFLIALLLITFVPQISMFLLQ